MLSRESVELCEECQGGEKITLELLISSELETKASGLQVSVCSILRNVYQNPKW